MDYLRAITFLLLTAFASASLAGAGEIEMESKADSETVLMTFSYDGQDLARMAMQSKDREGKGSMIMRDGKIYSAVTSDGQTVVIDMADMSKLASSFSNQDQSTELFYSKLISLDKTGKTESIAGIKGDVYTMVWDDNGTPRTSEIVLSQDKAVVDYTRAWINFGDRMADIFDIQRESENDLRDTIVDEKVGILRMDDQFILTSLTTKRPSPATFELPAEPMEVPNMEGLGKLLNSAPADTDTEANSAESEEKTGLWGAISKKLDRQANRQKDRSDEIVDDATDEATDRAVGDAVDEAVDKVFDLFK